MDYNEIEDKYIKAKIKGHYWFENALEIKAVLGYDFRTIQGFKELSEEHKKLAERLIIGFVNGFGLGAREKIIPESIERDNKRRCFKLTYNDKTFGDQKYSYLFDNGSVG